MKFKTFFSIIFLLPFITSCGILFPPTPTPIPPIVIVNRLRNVSELTTATLTASAITTVSQDNAKLLGILDVPPTKVKYFATGDVRAGFDLSTLTISDVVINGQSVIITLPRPKILSYGITDSEVLDIDVPEVMGFDLGELEPETLDQAQSEALKEILQSACEQQILEVANQGAETSVSGLIALFNFEKVQIITQPAKSCP